MNRQILRICLSGSQSYKVYVLFRCIFTLKIKRVQRKYILPVFLLVQVIVLQIISFFPEFVETYYSKGFYIYISHFWRMTLGNIIFSVGDCIYGIVIFLLLRWIWIKRKTWKTSRKDNFYNSSVSFLCSTFYFICLGQPTIIACLCLTKWIFNGNIQMLIY